MADTCYPILSALLCVSQTPLHGSNPRAGCPGAPGPATCTHGRASQPRRPTLTACFLSRAAHARPASPHTSHVSPRSTSNQETFRADPQGRLVFDVLRQVGARPHAFHAPAIWHSSLNAGWLSRRPPCALQPPSLTPAPSSQPALTCRRPPTPRAQVLTGQGLATFTLADCMQTLLGETLEVLAPHHLAQLQQQMAAGTGGGAGAAGAAARESRRAAAVRLARCVRGRACWENCEVSRTVTTPWLGQAGFKSA